MAANNKKDTINVNITTWKKRDKFLPLMLSHFYNTQTLLPDHVYIWLSKEEYNVLPEHLASLEKIYQNLKIRYVKENTYCHKRWEIFKYDNSSYNLMMDDDLLYPPTYIEEMYNAAKKHKNKVICYFAREMELTSDISYTKNFIENNKKNKLYAGLCCIPPNKFPLESFKYKILRDTYSFKCDESWVMSWFFKKNIFIYGLHEWPSTSVKTWEIGGTRMYGLHLNVNSKQNIFSSQKFLSLSNCVYSLKAAKQFEKIWPEYQPEKYSDLGGISICITAYKATKFIKETLDSIITQTYFKLNNNWEIIIGIDGCEETLNYIKSIMHNYKNIRVYMMKSNMGTYITTNTIMNLAKYDKLFRFDSDDIMLPDCVEKIMNLFREKPDTEVCRLHFDNVKSNKIYRRNGIGNFGYGQHVVKKRIFKKFNGYRPWKCSGDYEFLKRIHNFVKEEFLQDVVYLLRWSENSLTSNPETNSKSEIRKYCAEFIKTHSYNSPNEARLDKCVINSYKKIVNNTIYDKDEYIEKLINNDIAVSNEIKHIKTTVLSKPATTPENTNRSFYNPYSRSVKTINTSALKNNRHYESSIKLLN